MIFDRHSATEFFPHPALALVNVLGANQEVLSTCSLENLAI
jgi:hypothetical protein